MTRPSVQQRKRQISLAIVLAGLFCQLASQAVAAGDLPTINERFGLTGSSGQRGELGTDIARLQNASGYVGLAFGAPAANSGELGAVARWQDTGAGWTEGATPTISPSANIGDRFGAALASLGDRLLVAESSPPELHVYQVQGAIGSTTLQQSLSLQVLGTPGQRGAVSLAAFSDYLAVGTLRSNNDSGSVELFRLQGGQWVPTTQVLLEPGAGAANAAFGHAMAMTEDRLFVGTPYFSPVFGEVNSGVIWQYSRPQSGTNWTLSFGFSLADLSLPTEQPAQLGYSLAAEGNLLVAGAPGLRLTAAGPEIGAVLIYERDAVTSNWILRDFVANPDPEPNARFGESVAIQAGEILVGAPGSAAGDGRAYVLRRVDENEWAATFALSSRSVGLHDYARSVEFAADGSYVVGAPAFGALGAVYIHRRPEIFADRFE